MKRRPVESVPELPYPTCEGEPLPEGEVLASGTLRAGDTMREQSVLERWEVRRRGCVHVVTVHQQWAYQVTDVEVIYDLEWKPLRAWKRMMIPGSNPEDHPPDIRLYELRNEPPTMSTRAEHVEGIEHREFQGRNPVAVIGPGRAMLAAWVQANDLEVGEVTRGNVLDFRQMVERIEEVALRRDAGPRRSRAGTSAGVHGVRSRVVLRERRGLGGRRLGGAARLGGADHAGAG